MYGVYDKQEVYSGVMVGLPYALCWPPPAWFTWNWKRLLSEEDYRALSFPPGWQTELYRGVVLTWTDVEVEALAADLDQYRKEARALGGEERPHHSLGAGARTRLTLKVIPFWYRIRLCTSSRKPP